MSDASHQAIRSTAANTAAVSALAEAAHLAALVEAIRKPAIARTYRDWNTIFESLRQIHIASTNIWRYTQSWGAVWPGPHPVSVLFLLFAPVPLRGNPGRSSSSSHRRRFSSVVWDILAITTQHFGLSEPLTLPEVPFPEPPAHRWIKVMLPNPAGVPVPTPVLFPMGQTCQGLTERDKVCLAKMYRFWQFCTRVNERAFKKRVEGLPPPRAWSQILEEVGHDADNRNYLWATDNHWEIRFSPQCWVKFGDDTKEVKWFEKLVA